MLHKCAQALTDKLYSQCALDPTRRAVFVYGFELSLSTVLCCIFIIAVSVPLQRLPAALLFLIMFISVRLFAGGYHAKTYGRCFILTNFVCWSVIIATELFCDYFNTGSIQFTCTVLTVLSCATVLRFAPIRHKNHPLSEARYRRNGFIARTLVVIESTIVLIVCWIGTSEYFSTLMSVTLAAVAVMMIIPIMLERRK